MKYDKNVAVNNQSSGVASFIVVFVLMIIMSLIALGFARVIRREQQQSLDRNLSAQAFYAAETGVNIAEQVLRQNRSYVKTTCGEAPPVLAGFTIDADAGVQVNCLLITNVLKSLDYQGITKGNSQVVPLNGAMADGSPTTISSLTLKWDGKTSRSNPGCSSSGSFPTEGGWACGAPLLRVDLVEASSGFSRNSWPGRTFTFFAYPIRNGGGTTSFSASQNNVVDGRCVSGAKPAQCSITINGLSSRTYYARIVSLYGDAVLNVTANNGTIYLAGAQALIDSTGKARDVVRRIQVHEPITQNSLVPDFALQVGDGVCKKHNVLPPSPPNTPSGAILYEAADNISICNR